MTDECLRCGEAIVHGDRVVTIETAEVSMDKPFGTRMIRESGDPVQGLENGELRFVHLDCFLEVLEDD